MSIEKEIWKICHPQDNVFRTVKKLEINRFTKYSSLISRSKFVIESFVFYNVYTCQTYGENYF